MLGAAALSLWPPNADRVRALATLCDALPLAGSGPTITVGDWAAWLADDASSALRAIEPDGIMDWPPVELIAVAGARLSVLPGLLEGAGALAGLLADALIAAADPTGGPTLELLLTSLMVCDEMLEAAGRQGGEIADHSGGGNIQVPPEDAYRRLVDAVQIDHDALLRRGVSPQGTAPLVRRDVAWRRAVTADRATTIVGNPLELMRSSVAASWELLDGAPSVAHAVRETATSAVARSARHMGWMPIARDGPVLHFRFDVDKVAFIHVALPSDGWLERARTALAAAEPEPGDQRLDIVVLLPRGTEHVTETDLAHAGFDPLTRLVSLPQWQLIADALRSDPLGLWLLVDGAPPMGGGVLVDHLGAYLRLDAADDVAERLPGDPTECVHVLARVRTARHPAVSPSGRFVTVISWEGPPVHGLFIEDGTPGGGALLVRYAGIHCWVISRQPVADELDHHAALVHVVAYWAGQLVRAGWLRLGDDEIGFRLEVDFAEEQGPWLAWDYGHSLRLRYTTGFMHQLSQADNQADRAVVRALLTWWFDGDEKRIGAALEELVPAGLGTAMVWPNASSRLQQPTLPVLRSIPRPLKWAINLEVARAAFPIDDFLFAIAAANEARLVLAGLARAAVAILGEELAGFDSGLLRALIEAQECEAEHNEREAITLPAADVLAALGHFVSQARRPTQTSMALRFLIEFAGRAGLEGPRAPSHADLLRLRAFAESTIEWGSLGDAQREALVDLRVVLGGPRGVALDVSGIGVEATAAHEDDVLEAAPERLQVVHADWWEPGRVAPNELDLRAPLEIGADALDRAAVATWGFALSELMRACRALANDAVRHTSCVADAPQQDVAARIADVTALPFDRANAICEALTFRPDPNYDPLTKADKPWTPNRENSYLRRPLMRLSNDRLCWGASHVLATSRFIWTLAVTGRLAAPEPLYSAVRAHSQTLDRHFEDDIAGACTAAGLKVRRRCKKLGGMRLERARGQPIGDIDVLALHLPSATALLLDAKRLMMAFSPADYRREVRTLEKAAAKHLERIEWVRARPELLSRETGVDDDTTWRVLGAIVLDQPMTGVFMREWDIPFWTAHSLRNELVRAIDS